MLSESKERKLKLIVYKYTFLFAADVLVRSLQRDKHHADDLIVTKIKLLHEEITRCFQFCKTDLYFFHRIMNYYKQSLQ